MDMVKILIAEANAKAKRYMAKLLWGPQIKKVEESHLHQPNQNAKKR